MDLDVVTLRCLHRTTIWHERGLNLQLVRSISCGDDAGRDQDN